jgi:gliding motility-associated-like protein
MRTKAAKERGYASRRVVRWLSLVVLLLTSFYGTAQTHLPECTENVPLFIIDLSSNPDSTYTTPGNVVRRQTCCGTGDRYVSFYVTMHPDVAAFEIYEDGAPAYGSASYTIVSGGDLTTPGVCGTKVGAGNSQCIVGPGPHKILYDKPGSNSVKYNFRQIPKPIFPDDQYTRVGCTKPINIYGLKDIVIRSINSSTGNTTPGAYNNLLSCTDCDMPVFTPGIATPEWIEYEVCGAQIASTVCGVYATCGTFRVYTSPALGLSVSPNPASFCVGGSVDLEAFPSGGDGNYDFTWRDGNGNVVGDLAEYSATAQGNFTVELGDGLNSPTCPSQFVTVPVSVGQLPIVDAGMDQTVCAQNPTAFLLGSVTNATGGVWSGGAGTFNPSNTSLATAYTPTQGEIEIGFVELTLTSTGAGGGCANTSDVVRINYQDSVKVEPIFDPILCNGGSTILHANTSGGDGNFSYIWSTGSTASSINVSAGTYSVMVLDALGCGNGTTVTVTQPDVLNLSVSSSATSYDLDDNDLCTGSTEVIVSGGTPGYTYSWSPSGGTNQTASGLCYGVYSVTVTDANLCSNTVSTVVNNPTCSSFEANIISKEDVSCYGDTDGEATVEFTGGVGPFTIEWNDPLNQDTETATGLSAGTYTVTITDSNTPEVCQAIAVVTILQPTIITNVMSQTNVTTIGGNDGTATANPQGGTPGYTYSWDPTGQTTQTATGLTAGLYEVTITDSEGCEKVDEVLITQPPCNNFVLAVNPTNVSCFGQSNGSASLTIAHGQPPYAITWYNSSMAVIATNVLSVSGLAAGSYSVEVTDNRECTVMATFDITQPDQLSIGLDATNVTCFGLANGTIDLTVSGGTFPYSFQWFIGATPVATTEDLINLRPGTYSVTVTDANGCQISGTIGINQPSQIQASISATDITCFGAEDGTASATVTGGVTPYSYLWTGPNGFSATTLTIADLADSIYTFQVTDANLCNLSTAPQTFVNEPDEVEIVALDVPCPAPGATIVTVTVTSIVGGNEGPYQVSFDNGVTYQPAGNYSAELATGTTYQVWARDGNLCNTAMAYELIINSTVEVDDVAFNPCVPVGAITIPVTVSALGGDGSPYEVSYDNGLTFQPAGEYVHDLAVNTTYSIVVRDGEGCMSDVYEITIPAALVVVPSLENEVSCIGESDGSVSIVVTGGTTPYSYAWTGPGLFTSNQPNISGLAAGTYEITVTDDFSCTAVETVELTTFPDVTLPEITCPDPISVNNDAGICGAEVTYVAPVGTDNCPGASTTMLQGLAGGSIFPVGTTLVEYEVEDLAGNTASCSFNVTVIDIELPTITCPEPVNTVADMNECTVDGASVNLATPVTGDNCGVATVSNNAPAIYPVGTTIVTWTVVDVNGRENTCQQQVVVADTQAPIISSCGVIGNLDVDADAGVCTYTHSGNTWDVVATDNCTTITVEAELTGATVLSGLTTLDGVTFNPGVTTVTWTVTDAAMNVSTCNFTITILDTEDPVFTSCIDAHQTVETDPNFCTYRVTGTAWDATATDNCGIVTVTAELTGATIASGLITLNNVQFNIGTTTVTWTAEDNAGNSVTCVFDVVVEDNQLPSFVACVGSDQTVATDLNECTYTMTTNAWDATATDNCTTVTLGYVLTGATTGSGTTLNGVTFNLGTTTVTWTATDGSSNTETCVFDVVVEDNQLPSFVACVGSPQTVETDLNECTYTMTTNAWDATATDNCTTVTLGYVLTGATTGSGTTLNGVTFNIGTTTVTWTATDGSSNTETCVFDVVVEDNQLPSFVACVGSPQTVETDLNECTYTMTTNTWDATATDNCTTVTLGYVLTGATTGSGTTLNGVTFNLGTTTVTWTATDGSSNTETCVFDVIVEDNQLPSFVACVGSDQTVATDLNECTYTMTTNTWDATATDNCTTVTLGYVLTGATTGSGTTLNGVTFNLGTTTVTWTATDGSSNTETCVFDVIVEDNQLPSFVACVGSDQTVATDLNECTYTMTTNAWDATATDNCTTVTLGYVLTGATTGSGTTLNGVTFNLGTTTVTWTATDGSSNTETCVFDVVVEDNQFPEVIDCPISFSGPNDVTFCGANVSWDEPTFEDNCLGASMTASHAPNDYFTLGTTEVVYVVTDGSGNETQCVFNVTVLDEELPLITCPPSIGTCDPLVTYDAPVATDNCGVSTIEMTAGLASGSEFPVGITPVTYLVTDIHGNENTCSFNVEVYPLPVLTLSPIDVSCNGFGDGSIELTVTNGTPQYSYLWSNEETTQNVSGLEPGVYGVTVVDANGCSGSAQATINQPLPLTINGVVTHATCFGGNNGSVNVTVEGGIAPYSYVWSNEETTEDVTGLTAGTYSVVVTDQNGCTIGFEGTVAQPTQLVITYSANNAACNAPNGSVQTIVTGGVGPYSYLWSNESTSQNLTDVLAGDYTLVVTDANGCTAEIEVSIASEATMNASVLVTNVTCYGRDNGGARVVVLNGNQPFTYLWSNGAETSEVTGLGAGEHSVTVTDAYGCSIDLLFEITQPEELVVNLSSPVYLGGYNVTPWGASNGSIETGVDGGTSPYTYLWSNGQTTPTISGMPAGNYSVVVTDENGCVAFAQLALTQPYILEMPTGISPNGDGKNDYFVVHGIDAYPENEITIFNRWGNVVYQKNNYANEWDGTNTSGEPLPDATYFVILNVQGADGTITLKGYVDLRR